MNVARNIMSGLGRLNVVAVILLLAACSSGGGDTPPPPTPAASVTLTVATAGSGTGTVTSTPAGLNCGATCTLTVSSGSVVTLTAAPAPNNTLTDWGGACPTGSATCAVTVNGNQTVTATFSTSSANPSLSVTFAGTGVGSMTCNGGACNASYPWGTSVTVSGVADANSSFAGWSGGGCTGTADCTVLLWANTQLTATFNLLPVSAQLSVAKDGTGTGTVNSNPAGINCGATCSESYAGGTVVTLTAAPTAGSTFAGWSGGGCAGIGTCDVTLNANTTVTATFNTIPPTVTFSFTTSGTGTGSVACNGAACQPSYPSGTALTIVATPAATSLFSGWGGDCAASGAATTCNLTINANSVISATFNLPTLSVVVAGTGTVTSNPVGINCGATCTASFNKGTSVTLTATGAGFTGWSGGGCSGTGTCLVTLNTDTTVTAGFGAVSGSGRYRFFTTAVGGGPLMAVNPSFPSATPITVAASVASAAEAYAVSGWNSTTATFEGMQSPYEVYISGGKIWRVNSATSSGAPGSGSNPPVQISNETAASGVVSVIDDTTPVNSHWVLYSSGGTTKLTSLGAGTNVSPIAITGGTAIPYYFTVVYNLASGVATHVFLQGPNNGLAILDLNTKGVTQIQANVGTNFWVLAQDTSDRLFILSKAVSADNALYVYTISTNTLHLLVSATPGGTLLPAEIPSDGTNLYLANMSPGILYKVPLTATLPAHVVTLLNQGASMITGLMPATNRVYVLTSSNQQLVSVPKAGGASRIDVTAGANEFILPLFHSRNGLVYLTQFTIDTTVIAFPPPVLSSAARVIDENNNTVAVYPDSAYAGVIFSSTYSVRSELAVPSKMLITGFSNSTYGGGTLRALDAATGLQTATLGTVPVTSPSLLAMPGLGLYFIEFLDSASLGFGQLSDLSGNSAVFFVDTAVQNSLVQVPVAAGRWVTSQN